MGAETFFFSTSASDVSMVVDFVCMFFRKDHSRKEDEVKVLDNHDSRSSSVKLRGSIVPPSCEGQLFPSSLVLSSNESSSGGVGWKSSSVSTSMYCV
eukprot:2588472-Ditylum_brightwellii.AAC.1